VRPIGPVRKDFFAATLRSRYAELLRLRGHVQRLERLSQDQEEVHKRGWLAAMNEQYGAED
jgi:hypothetical protein